MLVALEEELRFAPREARLRCMDRAERLSRTIEDAAEYPAPWVIEAITGYRPEGRMPGVARGAALRAGLGVFVERQSARADLTPDEVPGGLGVPEVLARWDISRATLGRLRRLGLAARRVRDGRAGRAVFHPESIAWFEQVHADRLGRAAAFTRLTPEETGRLVRRASRYRRCLRWPMTRVVQRLAQRTGRSPEGVRQALRRAGAARRDEFDLSPHLDARTRRVLARAARLGVDVGLMARKVRRSRGAVRRAIAVARADRLRDALARGVLTAHVGPTFALPDAGEAILAPPAVREGLGLPGAGTLRDVLGAARAAGPPIAAVEKHRAVAGQFLVWRAAMAIEHLHTLNPSPAALDRIETDLRWAARLRAELIRVQWPTIVRSLEARIGRPCADVPARELGALLHETVLAAARAVEAFDPFRGGRLAGPVGLAADRVGAAWVKAGRIPVASGRATPVLGEHARLDEWTHRVAAWQVWIEPPERVRAAAMVDRPTPADAALLRARFGWGEVPHTLAEVGARFGITPTRMPIVEARAIRSAR